MCATRLNRPDFCSPLQVVRHLAACGNGVLEGLEQCDDGNTQPGDGCDATCKVCSGELCGPTTNHAVPGINPLGACRQREEQSSKALNLHPAPLIKTTAG